MVGEAKVIRGGERATERPRKLFVQVFGKEGTGKSSFALSFPPPLYVANLDRNMDDLFEMLPPHYEIHYVEVPYDVDISAGVASNILMKVDALMKEAFRGGVGTFFLDGADLFWDVVKEAKLPADANVPNQWGPANKAMEGFYRRAEASPIHVVFSSIASTVWAGQQKETNQYKADGFKHAGRFINTSVYLFTQESHMTPSEKPVQNNNNTHSSYIATAKLNDSATGMVLPNPTFKMLYRMMFGILPPDHEQLWTPGRKWEAPAA